MIKLSGYSPRQPPIKILLDVFICTKNFSTNALKNEKDYFTLLKSAVSPQQAHKTIMSYALIRPFYWLLSDNPETKKKF